MVIVRLMIMSAVVIVRTLRAATIAVVIVIIVMIIPIVIATTAAAATTIRAMMIRSLIVVTGPVMMSPIVARASVTGTNHPWRHDGRIRRRRIEQCRKLFVVFRESIFEFVLAFVQILDVIIG